MVDIFKKFSWAEWMLLSVVSLVILIPKFDFITVSGTTTAIRVEDFALAAIYFTWVVWLIKTKRKLKFSKVHLLMLAFLLVGIASTGIGVVTGSVENASLGVLNVLRRVEYFLIFFVAYSWLNTLNLHRYLWVLIGISAAVAYIGILQFFQLLPMYSTWEGYSGMTLIYNYNYSFLISTFAGHYELGGYLLIMIPLAMLALFRSIDIRTRIALALLLMGYYFLLYFSFSRAAYAAIMGQAIMLMILFGRPLLALFPALDIVRIIFLYLTGKYSKYDYDIGIVTAPKPSLSQATMSATASAQPVQPSARGTLQVTQDSAITLDPGGAVRVDVWTNAINHFKQNPILGTGYSSIGTGADNQYLRTAAETGLVGLGVFASTLGYIIYFLWKASHHTLNSLNRNFLLASIAIVIGLMAQAVLIDIFDASKVAILFWFVMALAIRVAEEVSA